MKLLSDREQKELKEIIKQLRDKTERLEKENKELTEQVLKLNLANEAEVNCSTCKFADGWRCNNPQGCEMGTYELWEQKKTKIIKMSKIITSYDFPPIPDSRYDWSAAREDYDEGDLIGYGSTEQVAINNLKEQESEIN